MIGKIFVAAATFAAVSLAWPVAAQIVGGPNKPKTIGGPVVHSNPVVAPVRGTVTPPISTSIKLPQKKT